jgi:formylglycine-generating enzyme required for sulfatase activity
VRPNARWSGRGGRAAALALAALWAAAGCAPGGARDGARDAAQEAEVPRLIAIPAGPFIAGSDRAEREAAYRLDEAAYGHSVTRRDAWYANEPPRTRRSTGAFAITATPITNGQYAAFVRATGHPAPDVDEKTWKGYGLIHPYGRTRRHAWIGGRVPEGRGRHPVVLVSHADARAYARWLSLRTGRRWRLPTEEEWEKAARGPDGATFPWGGRFDAERLNSHDAGPFDTMAVGSFPKGASPYGLLDAAGQVFEWTSEPAGPGRFVVKGGSWDDRGCGICRPAARHGRPEAIRHILIGFRLVREE